MVNKKYILVLLLLCCLVSPVLADSSPTEDQGFWAETFWGTAEDPGIFRGIWEWFSGLFSDVGSWVFEQINGALPESLQSDFGGVVQLFKIANCWFPIDYAFILLMAYLAFVAQFSAVKIIIKMIPGIG